MKEEENERLTAKKERGRKKLREKNTEREIKKEHIRYRDCGSAIIGYYL